MSFLQDIYDYIKSGETYTEDTGLEIEHFVVDENGIQIAYDEVTELIEKVGREIGAEIFYTDGHPSGYSNDRYSVTLEPSCQFEISINPYSELSDIEEVYNVFLELWEPVFKERGYNIVTKGVLPAIELGEITPDDIPLSDKKRYRYMDAYFRKSGKYGKYMMRASASTQVSVDYSSETDLIKKLGVLQKISPILMIMMENKTKEDFAFPEALDKPHLLRIQEWDDLDRDRTGFYPHSLEPYFGYGRIADVIYNTPLILLTDNGTTFEVGDKSANDIINEGIVNPEEFDEERKKSFTEHVLSMGFFHFRIKKYIEIRVADSVPIKKALGYVALIKGIVYSEHNLDILEKELSDIYTLDKIQEAVEQIKKDGLKAKVYHGLTAAEWAERLVETASQALPERDKEYLKYV